MSEERKEQDPRSLTDEQWKSAFDTLKSWQYRPEHYDDFMVLARTMAELNQTELYESALNRKNGEKILWGHYSGRIRQVAQMMREQLEWAQSVNKGLDA